ncbi:hypothetical protein MPSI1_002249 [Malassezia psittaci]|uniref:Adenosylmethionine-8-amino-7-oxononanoate aminotransferase n=1 Tax=Malassezia psittaci TaxID=1821823 RepID=A0AAF0FC63_9BASI|nr:hypothetical protein MPSI1_002249 [Malassezia psittaci]
MAFAGRLQVHQVFGADTDVGKTIFATGLALAASACEPLNENRQKNRVAYLKPVSTGPLSDADASHLQTFAPKITSETGVQFDDPVSPHLAASQATGSLPENATDAALLHKVRAWLDFHADPAQGTDFAIVETAGGVHSPAPSGASQADLLRPLRLPTVLVGSSKLGGISITRTAFECLHMRGYDVDAVLLFPSPRYQNDVYLRQWLNDEFNIPVYTVGGPSEDGWGAPPPRAASNTEDVAQMHAYYRGLVHGNARQTSDRVSEPEVGGNGLMDVVRHLQISHKNRHKNLNSMAPRTYTQCWWPFTQHTRYQPEQVMTIDSAHGDHFAVYQTDALKPVLDGSASWWTQCLGHAHPRLSMAAAYAAGRYGHVLFPGAANAPALELTERMLGRHPMSFQAPGKHWADRVFFSDDGSTAMEVALKMAIESCARRYDPQPSLPATQTRVAQGKQPGSLGGRPKRQWKVLGLQGSYHGDTIGAMDACEPSIYSERVSWYKGRGHWLSPPTITHSHGKIQISLPSEISEFHPEDLSDEHACYESLGDVYKVSHRLLHDPLAKRYARFINAQLERLIRVEGNRFGALVLEPLVMGAGGMLFVDPLFQRVLIDTVRSREDLFAMQDPPLRSNAAPSPASSDTDWKGLPVIFDEVFTGLFRLGWASGAQVLDVNPDIACYAKILSGGLVPLSVTLATEHIFSTFAQSDQKTDALLHGHSYTAHPVGCSVACKTLEILDEMYSRGDWVANQQSLGSVSGFSCWDEDFVQQLSYCEQVKSALGLGTVLKIELADADQGYASSAAESLLKGLSDKGLHLRPLGNVIYVMCSLTTGKQVLDETQRILLSELSSVN